ncbi:unnamed protein product [Adineta ricciae]|uniref:RRM domain-containing protein n=1 Tax=Adineta ricciae TaxID=249248 RepID=A0A814E566_ADIRI|nr:unnamed protein product [Adineta ricciae]
MGRSRDRSYSRSRSHSRSRSGSLSSSSSGRTGKARDWNGEGGCRLHLSDLAMGVSRREIEKLFRPFGPLNEVWVASNPPCFAFINFRHRADGERAMKELDGKAVNGSRIGLSWARPRNPGGRGAHASYRRKFYKRSLNKHASLHLSGSRSPPYRRGYRDSYSSRRHDDRYSRRRYSRSRSRSPGYRRSERKYRRRSPSSQSRSRTRSRSRSTSSRDGRRDQQNKKYNRDTEHRRHRSSSHSENGSPGHKNGKRNSRSPSAENHQVASSNGHTDDHHVERRKPMTDTVSLEQLVYLSLGDPEAGAVNFNVLKTLLLQMLKAMNLFNYKPTMTDHDQRAIKEALSTSTTPRQHVKFDQDGSTSQVDESDDMNNENKQKIQRRKRDRSQDRLTSLEEKVSRFESQLNALNEIPSNSEIIDRAKQIPKHTSDDKSSSKAATRQGPILEVWQYTQMEKRLESAENGITRLASLLQDLISDMNDLKESHENVKQTTDELKKQQDELKRLVDALNKEKHDWAKKSDVENLDDKIRNLQNLLASLRDRFDELAKKSHEPNIDPANFVTWDRLEDAFNSGRESIEKSPHQPSTGMASTRDTRLTENQTSDKRKDLSAGGHGAPSDKLLKLLALLGTLNDRHEQLRALVEELQNKKLDRDEFEAFKNQHKDLLDRLAALERDLQDILSKEPSAPAVPVAPVIIREEQPQAGHRSDHSEDIADFRTALQRLREDLDRLKKLVQDLVNKGNLSSQDIEKLKKLIEQLEQNKADKTYVNNELDKKADKRDLDNRVLKKDFNSTCNELSQNINDCMQKFNVHEDIQKQDLNKMNTDIDGKINRSELDALREYLEKQLKKLKRLAKDSQPTQQQHQHVPIMSEDEAAGLRKPLIRFHCISCDRPIDVQPHPQQPSLPANLGMRPIQSPRPYTTYELDQIRQFQKSQQFSNDLGGGVADVYATVRQCGGSHTTTLPFKRQIKTQPTVSEEGLIAKNEVDIKGHDGVIYKGRIDVNKLPAVDMQKKTSVALLTPAPPQRFRSDSHPSPYHHTMNHGSFANNDQELNDVTPVIPNLEPALPREETFT